MAAIFIAMTKDTGPYPAPQMPRMFFCGGCFKELTIALSSQGTIECGIDFKILCPPCAVLYLVANPNA